MRPCGTRAGESADAPFSISSREKSDPDPVFELFCQLGETVVPAHTPARARL